MILHQALVSVLFYYLFYLRGLENKSSSCQTDQSRKDANKPINCSLFRERDIIENISNQVRKKNPPHAMVVFDVYILFF